MTERGLGPNVRAPGRVSRRLHMSGDLQGSDRAVRSRCSGGHENLEMGERICIGPAPVCGRDPRSRGARQVSQQCG